jgi:5-methylcytosine-specific restriction endonuclease McrA
MKKYTKIYMNYHNYDISDWIACEHCGTTAVDIHHLEGRKMGGSKNKDFIENLIALCRRCHIKAETDKNFNNQLKELNKQKHS